MNQEQWLNKFSLAVRWRLPPTQAAEVVSDYRELLAESGEAEPCKSWGAPAVSARRLGFSRRYGAWLAVFFLLSACPAGTAALLFLRRGGWGRALFLFTLGLLLSLLWFFRLDGEKPSGKLPKGLVLWLGGLLAVFFAGMGALAVMGTAPGYFPWLHSGIIGAAATAVLRFTGFCAVLSALAGLVLARVRDRRWQALYLLGLTVAAVCLLTGSHLWSMTLTDPAPALRAMLIRASLVFSVGTGAGGVALC